MKRDDVERLDMSTVNALRQLADAGEPDPFPEFAQCFLDHAPERLSLLTRGASAGVLREGAHGLRGMSATVGAARLAALCAELERGVASSPAAEIGELVETIHDEFREVRRLIEHAIDRPPLEAARPRSPS